MSTSEICIGIDFGTTHGCVGVWQNDKVNVIANDQGFRTTPCYVSFEENDVVVGDAALNKFSSNSTNTVYHLKRLLGKTHSDIKGQGYLKQWSFSILSEDEDSEELVEKDGLKAVIESSNKKKISAVEFCSIVISKLKHLAEDYTGETISNCVMSVPVNFTSKQKQLIDNAAKKAGIKVMRYISEPVAALIAYGFDDPDSSALNGPEFAVVVDIGGASSDITIVQIEKGLFKIVANVVDESLGGEDFTNVLVEHCMKSFEKKNKVAVVDNQRAIHRLKLACEQGKRSLASQTQINIEVDSLVNGIDFSFKLSRSRFEDLISQYIGKIIKDLDTVLEKAELDKEHVNHIVLIGGCARIPKVQTEIEKYFNNTKKVLVHISPDEAVAYGTTVEASLCIEEREMDISEETNKKSAHVDIIPLTISAVASDGRVIELVHRGTMLPASAKCVFTNEIDNQESVFIQIVEGERAMGKDNTLLAEFSLLNEKKMNAQECKWEVHVTINKKGDLEIIVRDLKNKNKELKKTLIPYNAKRLKKSDVQKIIENAKAAEDEDLELLEQLDMKKLEMLESEENVDIAEPDSDEIEDFTVVETTSVPPAVLHDELD